MDWHKNNKAVLAGSQLFMILAHSSEKPNYVNTHIYG